MAGRIPGREPGRERHNPFGPRGQLGVPSPTMDNGSPRSSHRVRSPFLSRRSYDPVDSARTKSDVQNTIKQLAGQSSMKATLSFEKSILTAAELKATAVLNP